MKVLWITNILFPPICEELNIGSPVVGGWMYSSARTLLDFSTNLKLAVASIYSGDVFIKKEIENINYYLLPSKGNNTHYQKSLEPHWLKVIKDFGPDLVHLHGTEFAHGLAFLRTYSNIKSVVSIQGLVSVYARYYLGGLTCMDLLKSITLRDILKGSLHNEQKKFVQRGEIEIEILRRTQNIIGRTSWDKVHTWAINPKAKYHFCNETLRESFYVNHWKYENCQHHSIFISQANYPIKGLHQVLKALPLILKYYPDTKVYVAGENVFSASSISRKLRLSGYGNYIRKLIRKYDLGKVVIFTGPLDETQMSERYLNSNVFVCPSSIENSPNSLGEAQLLGTPCVAAYVGGIPTMMKGLEHWMYRYEEIEMLAERVVEIFSLSSNVPDFSIHAVSRHNKTTNGKRLISIYNDILK